jgi:hypothetical protein
MTDSISPNNFTVQLRASFE